jgi:RNA ligase
VLLSEEAPDFSYQFYLPEREHIVEELFKKFEGRHPAYEMPFHELLTGLTLEVEAGNVSKQTDGNGLEIYCYTPQCTYDKNWNIFSLMARGLILDVVNEKIVATPFPKFFNYSEVLYMPQESFEVTEKMDGSLGIIFFHDGKWKVSTKGSFQSDQAKWAQEYFDKNINQECLSEYAVYLVEIIYPENRIVIPYDFKGLILLSIWDSGFEVMRDELTEYPPAVDMGFKLVEVKKFDSIEQILKEVEGLKWDKEGFVVRFKSGYRLKIKGAEYCRIHRLISNCTPLAIWDCMRMNSNLDGIRKELPEEFHKDFDAIRKIFDDKINQIIKNLEKSVKVYKHWTDKELGLALNDKEQRIGFAPEERVFLFACRKSDFLKKALTEGAERDKLFKFFRPQANVLDNYVPSNAMNRFDSESK